MLNLKFASFGDFFNDYKHFYRTLYRPYSEQDLYNIYILGEMPEGKDFYRPVANKASSKKPILLFGCSFVYGIVIPEDRIFSEVLAKYTDRPVYNRAYPGLSTNLMLYQLQNEDFYKIIPEPEYVIYVFIHDHPRRLVQSCITHCFCYHLFYKLKNGKLIRKNYKSKIVLVETLKQYLYKYRNNYKPEIADLFRAEVLESNRLIKKHWKNTKFILFVYSSLTAPVDKLQKEFEENGIQVIYRSEIAPFDDHDTKYTLSKTDSHPNANAWEYITPRLVEKLRAD